MTGRPPIPPSAPRSLSLAADEIRVLVIAAAVCLGTALGLRWPIQPHLQVLTGAGAVAIGVSAATVSGVVARRCGGQTAFGWCRITAGLAVILALSCIRGGCSARAYQPMEIGALRAEAIVRGDPEPIGPGWRAELQLPSGERLEATAFGRAGFGLRQVAVGERVLVGGRVRPIGERPWLRARHIVGRLSVDELTVSAPADGFDSVVNRLRSVIVDGAASFDDRSRSLYTGLVIGDDRFQPLAQQAQFRASGLTHLLAVSGQNVAFVLLVARPLLLLFPRRVRLAAVVGVLVVFAAMTRAEPSVLRAATAAGVATWALMTGRIGSGVRTLAAGVAGLGVVDPFLLDVVAFQLSVAASAGIIILSPLVLSRLPLAMTGVPGGTAVAQAVAVTVGAQIGVAPLLVRHFGPLPLASIPANLVAGWAAGAVMTLGLTVGPISGLLHRARLPGPAAALQWPAVLLVNWIDGVARWSAGLGLPRLGSGALVALALIGTVIAIRPRHRHVAPMVVTSFALVAILAAVGTGDNPNTGAPTLIAEGVLHIPIGPTEHDDGLATVLVVTEAWPSAVDAVLASGVDRVDVVITTRGDARAARIVGALIEVVEVTTVLAPPQHRIRGATRVTAPLVVTTGWGVVAVEPDAAGSRLRLTMSSGGKPIDLLTDTVGG